jgi:low affinity Fe/Cu permease
MNSRFESFSAACARFTGRPAMLAIAVLLAALAAFAWTHGNERLMWAASLTLNAVVLILLPILQATQKRDDAALHAKLDELIKTDAAARNALIGLEKRSQDEIEELRTDEEQSALP